MLSQASAPNLHLLGAGELEALQGAMGTGDQTEVLGRLISRVATLEAAAGDAEAQRRALHNQLVELRGNVSYCAAACSYSLPGTTAPSSAAASACLWQCCMTVEGLHCFLESALKSLTKA